MRGVRSTTPRSACTWRTPRPARIEVFDLNGKSAVPLLARSAGRPDQMVDGARSSRSDARRSPLGGRLRRTPRAGVHRRRGAQVGVSSSPARPAPPGGLASARGITVDPTTGDVSPSTAGTSGPRFAPDGTLLRRFGQRGSFPPDGMNYPRSTAVDPATGNIWVGNYEGDPMLMVYDRNFNFMRQIATPRFVKDIEIIGNVAYVLMRRTRRRAPLQRATGELIQTALLHQPRQSARHRGRPADRPLLDHLGRRRRTCTWSRRRAPDPDPSRRQPRLGRRHRRRRRLRR